MCRLKHANMCLRVHVYTHALCWIIQSGLTSGRWRPLAWAAHPRREADMMFNSHSTKRIALLACEQVGLRVPDLQLIRLGENAL